ncbi:MAG TPA: hypothetical protein EYO73_10600, partial [Sulfurimonas sp.]|nr:hypothetical protein [Sulfurimonas sp.]
MTPIIKRAVLLCVLILNYVLVTSISLEPINWNSFFPSTQKSSTDGTWFSADSQYLFIELDDASKADTWIDASLISNYYELNKGTNLYLLLFDNSMHNKLMQEVSKYPIFVVHKEIINI